MFFIIKNTLLLLSLQVAKASMSQLLDLLTSLKVKKEKEDQDSSWEQDGCNIKIQYTIYCIYITLILNTSINQVTPSKLRCVIETHRLRVIIDFPFHITC